MALPFDLHLQNARVMSCTQWHTSALAVRYVQYTLAHASACSSAHMIVHCESVCCVHACINRPKRAGPWMQPYLVNQFLPLLIFFFVFLVVVRNKKLHHFVRFNAMQAMMCDILVMLPIIIQRCVPLCFWLDAALLAARRPACTHGVFGPVLISGYPVVWRAELGTCIMGSVVTRRDSHPARRAVRGNACPQMRASRACWSAAYRERRVHTARL